jgi:RNA polymerase sigma-70 factor (ECF subfamily)
MSSDQDDSLRTRETLLGKLRDLDDQESWRTFFDRYWRLIYNVARRAGLDDADAQDVVQDTVIAVARRMPGFHYEPARGSFKQWLLRITRRRITDHLRRAYRKPPQVPLAPENVDNRERSNEAATEPHPDFEGTWNQEWEQAIFAAAVAQVRQQANPKHFQVFQYCVLEGWSASKVGMTLGLNPAQVYLAKHRIAQAVKRVVRQLAQA